MSDGRGFYCDKQKMNVVVLKVITGTLLGSALYLAVTCPCPIYLECHREKSLALLLLAAVPAVVDFTPQEALQI